MHPYYGHYYSHEDYVSAPFQGQAYDSGFIDERLMGPPGPPQGFPGFPPSSPQQGPGHGQGQGKGKADRHRHRLHLLCLHRHSHNKLEHLQWIQAVLDFVYSDLRIYG